MYKKLLSLLAIVAFIAACKKDSIGSKDPQINPVQGTIKVDWGDTITIAGKNLPSGATVFFDQVQAQVISNNGQALKCVVPYFNTTPTVSVFIKFDTQSIEMTNYVTLNAPVISSFTPTEALGDTITIKGDHFNSAGMDVTFGGAESRIIAASKTMLSVIVPDDIKSVHTTITVKSQLQTATSTSAFEVLKPVITSITPAEFIGNNIIITGKYFDVRGPFEVDLDGVPTPHSGVDKQHIAVVLPYKAYPHRKTTVTLKLLEYTIPYPLDVSIKDNWVMVTQGIPFSAYNATPLNVGSDVYIVAAQKGTSGQKVFLWHFNQADYSWAMVGGQLTFTNGSFSTGTDGSKIYLYSADGSNTFYACDPGAGTWTQKANFIGTLRYGPAMFSIGGKIYVGSGQHFVGNQSESIDDWYAYTPGNNTWARIADMRTGLELSYPMQNAQSVVINNIAYVVCGGWFFDYKYNPSTNTWTPMQNMLEPRVQAGVVTYNQKIYTLKGYIVQNLGNDNRNVFSYDPVADTWTFEPRTIDPNGDTLNMAFATGGKIYMLTYDNSEFQNNLYEALTLP
ncbi:MAG: nanM [Mucilaginibacter sp.]|nr:nanM [Mucilaginibacter sp.]